MDLFDRAFGAVYDPVMRRMDRAGLADRRRELLRGLHGHVVEIGAGTGSNLAHLGDAVERVTLLEPSPAMVARLRHRVARTRSPAQVEVLRAPAEALPLGDATADAVISTLVLCSVDDLARSIAEARRVLRHDGALVLVEHVAADGAGAALQRVLEPAWRVVAQGCHLTRDTGGAVAATGFDVSGVTAWRLPGGGPAGPAITGIARRL